VEFE
jgi:hypothetical protein